MTLSRRRILALVVAFAAGVGTAVMLFAIADRTFSAADAIGSGTMAAAGILPQLLVLQYPMLRFLSRAAWLRSRLRATAVAAFVVNIPVFALLYARHASGDVFAPNEALLFATAFAVSGGTLGAMFPSPGLLTRPVAG
jgi:hypothetical protein